MRIDPRAAPVICFVNGAPLLQKHWRSKRVRDGDIVAFVKLPQGGDSGGSNPLKIVATIAVMAFAFWAGPAIFGAGTLMANLATGVIGVAGAMLVNALIPPPKPSAPSSMRDLAAASPTYSLQAQGNQARLGQAIPVIYGRHLIYPDFAAAPYTEFAGNEQYLYQLFCIGQGAYVIEEIRIEDTPIASFVDVQYEVVEPGGTVTLFPANVVTSVEVSGQEALTGVPLGPFVVNPSGTRINAVAVDIVASRGLFLFNDDGDITALSIQFYVEAQAINDAGTPIGNFFFLGALPQTITAASQTPQRHSMRYDVPEGRYRVRFTRNDAKNTSQFAGHDLNWVALRGYIPGAQSYGNVTMLAVRMRASNQLSGLSARRFNLIVMRKLETRSFGQWRAALGTQSIAWALADLCMNATYGGGRTPAQISIADLDWLDAVWTARGDTFNGIFDSTQTFWEALTQVARAGRAVPILQGGIIYFVRDQQGQLPTALYSMRNIVRGTFNLRYLMHTEDTVDAMEVEYFDETVWRPIPVLAQLPGSSAAQPGKTKLFGVTAKLQAWREGMTMLASNRYRRKFATFQTELEGHLSFFGDLVRVQHDLPEWGQFGEVISYNAGTKTVVLNEPMEWTVGAQHYVAFRTATGGFSGPWACAQGATAATLVLTHALDFTPYTGLEKERTQAVFGPGETHSMPCRVIGVRPRGERVEIAVVNEDDRVHTSDGGAAPPGPGWDLPPPPTVPVIVGDLLVVSGGHPSSPTVAVSWQAAAGAFYYVVEHSMDGESWTRIGDVTLTNITFSVPAGYNYIRVAPVGKATGPWRNWEGQVNGETIALAPPPAPSGLVATGLLTTVLLTWNNPNYNSGKFFEILRHTVNNSATASVIDRIPYSPAFIYEDALGLMGATRWYWVRIINNADYVGVVSNAATATTGFVQNGDIIDGAITGPKIALDAVTVTKIADNSISTPKLQANSVISDKIAANQISGVHIAANSIASSQIIAGAVTAGKLAAGAVTAGTVAANAITAGTIAAGAVYAGSGVITSLAVETFMLQNQAVTIPVMAYTGDSIVCSPGFFTEGNPVYVNNIIQSVVFPSSGATVSIHVGFHVSAQDVVNFRTILWRNGVEIFRVGNVLTNAMQEQLIAFPYTEWPGPGVWTYTAVVMFDGNSGSFFISRRAILLLETKK